MESLLIKSDTKNNQLIKEFALKLGASVKNLSDEDLEDISLGMLMDEIKTNEFVLNEEVLEYLDSDKYNNRIAHY